MSRSKYDKYIETILGYLFVLSIIQLIILVSFITNLSQPKKDLVDVVIYKIDYEEEEIKYQEEIEEAESQQAQYLEEIKELDKYTDEEEWFINYKILNLKYEDLGMSDTLYDMYSVEDVEYLYRCVETEVHGGDFLSKANVANVILNRVESDIFPNTIKGVVTQSNQFSYRKTGITNDTKLACEYAFSIGTDVEDAMYFHSGKWTEKFNGATYLMSDQVGHHFYRIDDKNEKEGK